MKIDTFLTLDAVLRGGSFAAAAQETHLTASAVSMQMKQLEQYVGQTLFDRSGLQVRPNALAHEVAAAMRGGLVQLQALRRRTSTVVEGTVRLGVIESMLPSLLPGILLELHARHPRVELRPGRGRSTGLTEAVRASELDAAVVAEPDGGGSSRLAWHRLFRREMRLIAPPTSTETTTAALFRQYEWIRYDRQTVSGALAARWVAEHVPTRSSVIELDSLAAIVAMVSAGLGIALLHLSDARICQAYPVRLLRPGRAAPTVQISLVTRKGDADERLLLAVRESIDAALSAKERQRAMDGV